MFLPCMFLQVEQFSSMVEIEGFFVNQLLAPQSQAYAQKRYGN